MRLSSYPYVVVRIACSKCSRKGQYRLARLADGYGSEMTFPHLVEMLSADCKLRESSRIDIYNRCGAFFPDLPGTRPPDLPYAMGPKLRATRTD